MTTTLTIRTWFAVYPDAVRMGLSDVNTAQAFFKLEKDAHDFGKRKWESFYQVKPVEIPFNETIK